MAVSSINFIALLTDLKHNLVVALQLSPWPAPRSHFNDDTT